LRPNIAVIGSLNMDIAIEIERPPRQGETILGESVHFIPGGKGANQAVAAARLGANVAMIGAVGADAFGDELLSSLKKEGVDMRAVKQLEGCSTGIASIILSQGDNSIIVVQGANAHCSPEDIERNKSVIAQADIILVQLEIPLETVAAAVQTANSFGKTVILNPAPARPLPSKLLDKVDFLTPNQSELALLSGYVQENHLDEGMESLLSRGVRHVITTLGKDGVAYKTKGGKTVCFPAYQVPVVDTTGAGDAFNAGLAYSLATKHSVTEAIDFASKVAALAVSKLGAQAGMPKLDEVNSFCTSQ
jgi:ribokinase